MTTAINPDHLRERMREQLDDANEWKLCPNCKGGLSGDDIEYGTCSQCGAVVDGDDDENLYD